MLLVPVPGVRSILSEILKENGKNPMLANADPRERFRLVCMSPRDAALRAVIDSGSKTKRAITTPTNERGDRHQSRNQRNLDDGDRECQNKSSEWLTDT
jgi:hypothetical protein